MSSMPVRASTAPAEPDESSSTLAAGSRHGDEFRYEEPPLCEDCAAEITVGALVKWDTEDEEEG
jgi:hypothetical protein